MGSHLAKVVAGPAVRRVKTYVAPYGKIFEIDMSRGSSISALLRSRDKRRVELMWIERSDTNRKVSRFFLLEGRGELPASMHRESPMVVGVVQFEDYRIATLFQLSHVVDKKRVPGCLKPEAAAAKRVEIEKEWSKGEGYGLSPTARDAAPE